MDVSSHVDALILVERRAWSTGKVSTLDRAAVAARISGFRRHTADLPDARSAAVAITIAEQDGQQVIVLRDPSGVFSEMIALPIPAFFIVSCFNGANGISDVQAAFLGQFGQQVRTEDVRSLAEKLDEYLLLDSPRYREKREELEAEYAAMPARPATHAGEAYPDKPDELLASFEAYFTLDGGAGRPDPVQADRKIAGLVLPHMDPRCSGACASWGLRALAESRRPDVFVILGTAHQPIPHQNSLSPKV